MKNKTFKISKKKLLKSSKNKEMYDFFKMFNKNDIKKINKSIKKLFNKNK
jgi:predicted MarR family transcription regulator